MGNGYTRQSGASIVDGNTIDDSHFNNEFNAIEAAFNATTGHSHDGTTGEGPLISLTGSVTGVLPLANGGTGVNLSDPNADRILFWDDSAGNAAWLTVGTGLLLSGTTLSANGVFLTDGDKGDITVSSSGTAWEIDAGVITNNEVASGANIDATKIGTGVVDNTEFNYLNGVTSAIQTQINTKAPTASPTFTGTVTVPATNFTVGLSTPFSDSAGTLTLQNIDAIDATTETTLEAALELDSLQGNLSVSHLNSGTGASASTYWRGDGTWASISTGTLNASGTPADNQIAVWTGTTTLEGDVDFTFDTATNTMNLGNGSGKLQFGSVDILVDVGGTMTLSNVDALNATTKGTIEATIDTLTNLGTIRPSSDNATDLGSSSYRFQDLYLSSTIELGHATDTTLSRRSAGDINIEGKWVLTEQQFRGHIFGLTLSNSSGDPTNDIDIAAGQCASDSSTPALMQLGASITKRLDATWTVGTNQGGMDNGAAPTNTTYHVWLIRRSDTGVVDALFSTSATSPTMPANYDQKRRIGSILRAAGAIRQFKQVGDTFRHVTGGIIDRSASSTFSTALIALTVPTGIVVQPILETYLLLSTTGNMYHAFGPGDAGAAGMIPTQVLLNGEINRVILYAPNLYTDTSAQIWFTCTGAGTVAANGSSIITHGWVDRRGKDA